MTSPNNTGSDVNSPYGFKPNVQPGTNGEYYNWNTQPTVSAINPGGQQQQQQQQQGTYPPPPSYPPPPYGSATGSPPAYSAYPGQPGQTPTVIVAPMTTRNTSRIRRVIYIRLAISIGSLIIVAIISGIYWGTRYSDY